MCRWEERGDVCNLGQSRPAVEGSLSFGLPWLQESQGRCLVTSSEAQEKLCGSI